MKQLRCDGTLASIAAQLAVDLNREAEKRATGFHGFFEDSRKGRSAYKPRLWALVDSEGRPDSGADSKQFVLLTCSSDVDAAAAWDLAILWRDHHLPAMKKKVLTPNFSTSR